MKDPFGFRKIADDLPIRLKQGGLATLGDPNILLPSQRAYLDNVVREREQRQPWQRIELKVRQHVAMTTVSTAVVVGDHACNEGFNSIITAHKDSSLEEISQILRHFYGRTKKEGVKQGRAERLSDNMFVAPTGSRIVTQLASEDLGRSGSITSLVMSEAGYIENWTEAWRSIAPALSDAWWRYIVMETTLRRNQPGDFREFIADADRGKFPPWKVNFTGWWANPRLKVPMDHEQEAEFRSVCPAYEAELVMRNGLSWEQARWYHDTRVSLMLGSYDAMKEAFPTTKDEALQSVTSQDYFDREAMRFYTEGVTPPIMRFKCTTDGLREFEATDSLALPHLEVWSLPAGNENVVIGADCADSDERLTIEGSENAMVVCNQDTGEVLAVYHGYCGSHEFADAIAMVGKWYNGALVVPEINNAGRAVVDRLRTTLNYGNLYKREKFQYSSAVAVHEGMIGFDTNGTTRGIMLDRLQFGINRRLWGIKSEYVVDCVKALGKRNGIKVRKSGKNANIHPDDGAIALALTGFGHTNLVDAVWMPKALAKPMVLAPIKQRPARRGYRIWTDDKESQQPKYDPVWQKWS